MTDVRIGGPHTETHMDSAQIHYGEAAPNGGLVVDVDKKGDMFCRFSGSDGSLKIGNIKEFANITIDDKGLKITHEEIKQQITPDIAEKIRDRCMGPMS